MYRAGFCFLFYFFLAFFAHATMGLDMKIRLFGFGVLLTALLSLVACGEDSSSSVSPEPSDDSSSSVISSSSEGKL